MADPSWCAAEFDKRQPKKTPAQIRSSARSFVWLSGAKTAADALCAATRRVRLAPALEHYAHSFRLLVIFA
jgi:hypothetical protein